MMGKLVGKLERIIVRLDVPSHWLEGKLLKFLRDDPGLDFKQAVLRAVRGYYLPEAFEGELEPIQFQIDHVNARVLPGDLEAFQTALDYLQRRTIGIER